MARQNVADAYPLTPIQQGMLFHDILEPGAYLVQVVGVLEGDLDLTAFEAAWQKVVDRHPVLRSAFVWKKTPKPLQVVARRVVVPFELEDWSGLDEPAQESRRWRFLAEDRARGLDLSKPPLQRITLARLGPRRWQLFWTLHHLLLDGWSYPLVLEEALELYEAAAAGQPAPPAPQRPPFRDYIAWLQKQDLDAAEAFWKRRLAGIPTPSPLDLGAAAGDDGHGVEDLALSESLSAAVTAFAAHHRLTPATLFEGAWARLLSIYSGEDTVLFGSIGSGRPPSLPGVESILGMFVSTLPVRADLRFEMPVVEWLQRLQEAQLEARGFDFTPLAEIQKWSSLPAGGQLFDSCLSFQSYPLDEALAERSGSLACRSFDILEEPGFPLMVVVSPGRALRLKAEYRRERFTATAVARLLRHLRRLLETLVAEPDLTLEGWDAVTAPEQHQLLLEWSRGRHQELGAETVCSLFARRAAASPDAVAADDGEEQLTYAQLLARARGLAAQLWAAGAGPETVVGLCVERSLDLPVGLLGILEVGAVALPLDPEHPARRLSFALQDSGARLVVTQQRVLDRLPELAGEGRSALLAEAVESFADPGAAAEPFPRPENLAYLVYTSGSTGHPKGVLVGHRALLNYCRSMIRRCDFGPRDRMLQFASPAFNVLIEEVFPVLLAGGTVVLHREDLLLAPAQLQRVLEEKRVTAVELPAAFWQEWVQDLDARGSAPPAALRLLLLGCERPRRRMLEIWRGFGVRLVYVFGLTETTITSSVHELPLHQPVGRNQLPIGRPLANTRLYVLDRRLQPVPAGVVGQLYIGGEGVGRGYRRRPELTAVRFVPDPWARRPGRRLYRTGDRARHRSDGALEFLGRLDYQLKIRGFRVEPGEVEAVLESRPEVRRAVVVAHAGPGQGGGGLRLVAYVVPEAEAPDFGALRRALESQLPDYMVPSRFVQLDELPLNPNGKVDRKALPAPDEDPAAAQRSYAAPRNETEALLAEIWGQVLGLPRVGVEDNFFELGGDSILSIQITARANRAGIGITARQLFEHPTVAGLATAAEGTPVSVAEQGPVTGRVPLTPVQRWFLEQERRRPEHFNLPLVLELEERWELVELERALSHLLRHHDQLRARFRRDPDAAAATWIQELPAPDAQAVDLTVVTSGEPATQDSLRRFGTELQQGLGLENGRLLRVLLLDPGDEGSQKLILAVHHLVVDAVSWRVLVEDLMQAYEAVAAGREPTLPPKTTSFLHWARRLEDWAASGRALEEAAYWLAEERGEALSLPVDDPEGTTAEGTAVTFTTRLPAPASEALVAGLPKAYRAGVQDALLAALGHAVADWTGSDRVRLELEGHGRREQLFDDVDLSRTVGWFTALYPLVLDLSPPPGLDGEPGAELVAVKEQLRAVPGDGVGYGVLRYLSPDAETGRRLAAQPEAEILFNYVGRVDDVGGDEGLPVRLDSADPGPPIDPEAPRTHLLAVNAGLRQGELEVAWTFSPEVHRRQTVEAVAQATIDALAALAEHCAQPGAGLRTPSDFPLAHRALGSELSLTTLRRILADAESALPGGPQPGGPGEEPAGAPIGESVADLYPLSPLQQGMLFHALYAPQAGLYMAQVVCELRGDLDLELFLGAWRRVVERHPVLRTAFAWDDLRQPVQWVGVRAELPVRVEDWRVEDGRGEDAGEASRRLQEELKADRERGFDLGRPPLLRLLLARLDDRSWQLVWSFHQSIFDGWSLPILFRDLFASYAAAAQETYAELPPVPAYRDYIAWLESQDEKAAEAFWTRILAGVESATPLPLQAAVKNSGEAPAHGEVQLHLGEDFTRRLNELTRRAQVTLNTLIQGSWALLLALYSRQRDVIFGATVSGRPADLSGVEGMVGLFINTLPIRVRMEPEEALLEWLRGLQQRNLELRQFQHTALADIQRWSDLPAGDSLFDSFLVFQNYPVEEALQTAEGLEVHGYRTEERPHYGLTLVAHPLARLRLDLAFDRNRMSSDAARGLLSRVHRLLSSMVNDPWARLGELTPLSPAEAQQVLVEWGQGPRRQELEGPATVVELFERQVASRPQSPALEMAGRTLTYEELDSRANQLARYLGSIGVEAGSVVGICLARSLEMVVATLAVWKAGGVFVPLDPEYPEERLSYLVEDSRPAVLLTLGTAPVQPGEGCRMVDLDAGGGAWASLPDDASQADGARKAIPETGDVAYRIYTSGTTGRPKAVEVEHGNLVHTLGAAQQSLDFGPGEVMLYLASFAFDISLLECFGPLVTGGQVLLQTRDQVLDPERLEHSLRRATRVHAVPSLMRQLVDLAEASDENFPDLRTIMLGGDRVPPELLRDLQRVFPAARIFVLYGPTEATIICAAYEVPQHFTGGEAWVGRPLPGVGLRVTGALGSPVPVEVAGELWVCGPGVSRGYHGRPQLTAEKFVLHRGERYYRTGDLVRWSPQGVLEFIGRADQQIKVRGFRVEPGEIEAVLTGLSAVREAVVIPREDDLGEIRLVAYWTAEEGPEVPSAEQLREMLAQELPEHMIPAYFVPLESLPLSPTGKLDRARLPAPDLDRSEVTARYQAPRDRREEILVEIFQQVLRRPEVGVDDNFFHLGGDSILSIQLVSKARAAGVHLTPRQLFEHPTVAELAQAAAAPSVQAEQGPVVGPVPLTPIQHAFLEHDPEHRDHFALPLLLTVTEALDPEVLERALVAIQQHHDAFRLRLERDADGHWAQRCESEELVAGLQNVDLSSLPAQDQGPELERLTGALMAGLRLDRGPVLQAAYYRLGEAGDRLFLAPHHWVMDGVSWRLVLEDLDTAYRQLAAGGTVDLGLKTTSFQAWARRLAELASGDGAESEEELWTEILSRSTPSLPLDDPQGDRSVAATGVVKVELGEEETRSLLQEVPDAYRTELQEVLLAAASVALVQWTGGDAVRLTLEGHGREEEFAGEVDLSRTVGWFTASYPVLLEPGPLEDPGAVLRAVKRQVRQIPNKGLGYGLWAHMTKRKGSTPFAEAAEISFNFLGQLDQALPEGRLLEPSTENLGLAVSPDRQREHLLQIDAQILGDRLEVEWTFSSGVLRRASVERVASDFVAALRTLMDHCLTPEAGEVQAEDFGLADFDDDDLAAALDQVGFGDD
ncbi:MAG: amino acid adenylation domain-containing protein [Acidobacteriota bacterium]|nr:amino acid adenylation domain-containing protein [Acidobacteriota bacterium]